MILLLYVCFLANFNPRPPWGGRLFIVPHADRRRDISIHALRGEGDPAARSAAKPAQNFNPRPPWGGRRLPVDYLHQFVLFQSTPSVGRATI